MTDAVAEYNRVVGQRDLYRARLDAVEETLHNVGAPSHDENGTKLNANGMLVDWLAGKRNPRWIGPDPMRELRDALIAVWNEARVIVLNDEDAQARHQRIEQIAYEAALSSALEGKRATDG